MKSSAKRFRWLMITLLTLFTVLCVGFTGFFAACKKDKDEDEEPEPEVTVEHTHNYEASWDWGTDYTTCDVTLTCTSTEGECDNPTVKETVTTTSEETTKATCEGTGLETYTATYEYEGKTYTDTKTETIAALGHAWPANTDTENVDWQWGSRTDEVVSLVVTCERCGVTLLDEEVKYETDETDEGTILSAEYKVDETLTYTSEYDTANDPEEHAHHYEPTAWTWSEDYSSCTVTLTCESVVGECPEEEKTITRDAEVTSEETTPATCEEEGETTYTATLEYNGHTYTDTKTEAIEALGHDYDTANAIWEWSVDSEGKATATVTIACSRDSSHTAWSDTQTGIEVGTDGLYHASIIGPDGVTPLTDDYELVEVQKEYHIDFSDPDTYTWIGTPDTVGTNDNGETFLYLQNLSSTYTTGILTYVASGASVNNENAGALFTNTASGTYFELDLSAFEGLYVSVSVKMSTNSDTSARSLYINTDKSTSSGIKFVTSSNKTDYQTLEYGEIISAGETLYLTWSNNIRIFSIDIEIVDENPNYCHCAVPSYPETTNAEHVVWDWENRDEESQEVNVTIYCTECRKIIVSEDTEYDVDVNDATKWYASVSEGGKTYESTYDIPQEGVPYEHTYTYSYSELLTASGNVSSDTQLQASWFTGSNEFLTYSGSSSNDKIRPGTSNGVIEIRDGTLSVTFKGTGSLTISVASTGSRSGNISSFALKDSSGKYVEGTYTEVTGDSAKIISATSENGTYYKVNYSTACEITFEITTPGTYTLVFNIDNSASASDFGLDKLKIQENNSEVEVDSVSHSSRATRITAIVMKDTFADGESTGEEDEGSSSGLTFEAIEGYEWVPNTPDLEFVGEQLGGYATEGTDKGKTSKVGSGGLNVGSFTFAQGIYFEDTSVGISGEYDINTQGDDITLQLTGVYNYITFNAQTAASGSAAITLGIYADGSSTPIYEWSVGSNADYNTYTATGYLLGPGTYVIKTSGACRMADLTIYEYIEESEPNGITATANTVDFLLGRSITSSDLGLIVTVTYANGSTKDITSGYDVALDYTQLQKGANGIAVSYSYTEEGEGGQEHTFTTTVTIYLYELESIEISDFSMEKSGSNYITHNVQKVYLTGGTVSYDYAAVTATASYGSGADTVTATFILTSDEVSFVTADSTGNAVTGAFSVAGVYTVTATVGVNLATGITSSYAINVVDATNADITTVRVIAPSDEEGAEQATYAVGEDGIITVATINDAIQLVKLLGAPDSVRKYIYVGAGQYWEKIYIDIPNLTLVGANSYDDDSLATRQDRTTGGTEIVYWAFNGLMDPSGSTNYSTVGSATVTVAADAIGFCAADITFRNYWNTNALYLECKAMYNDTQADAAYINADKVYFYNVTFTGYHDTLEAENGRQYYDHCYIEGRTDYIFGNTATCYFDTCTIHTIGAGDSNNGGYVMAIKGTGVDYGYIFNGCNFTTDLESYYKDSNGDVTVPYEGFAYTVEGTVSVARTWSGSDMHIAILNSTFDNGFSKEAYIASTGKGASGKNSRYTHMTSGQAPTPAYLVEYGNSGEGAISASLADTCTVYTNEADVADYLDFTKIFAIENGSVKYDDDWSGHSVEIVTATVTVEDGTYTVTGYKGSLSVADVIAAVNEQLSGQEIETLYDGNSQPVDAETKISEDVSFSAAAQEADMTVPASVTYDFSTSTIGTFGTTGWYDYLYVDLGTTGSFSDITSWYKLTGDASITVKLPAGATISIEMYEADSLAVNGTAVTATIDTNTYWYTYTAAGETAQEIKLSYASGAGSQSGVCIRTIKISVTVIYGVGDVIEIGKYMGATIEGGTGEYLGVFIDATNGKFYSNNNAGTEVCLNAGTILVINVGSGATITEGSISYYNGYEGKCSIDDSVEGKVTITASEQTYIYSITIVAKDA